MKPVRPKPVPTIEEVAKTFGFRVVQWEPPLVLSRSGKVKAEDAKRLEAQKKRRDARFRLVQGWRHVAPGFELLTDMIFATLDRRLGDDERVYALEDRMKAIRVGLS